VFGSVATESDAEDSDLDLLVDPTPGTTLLTLAALQNEAERLLGVSVDVQSPKSLICAVSRFQAREQPTTPMLGDFPQLLGQSRQKRSLGP